MSTVVAADIDVHQILPRCPGLLTSTEDITLYWQCNEVESRNAALYSYIDRLNTFRRSANDGGSSPGLLALDDVVQLKDGSNRSPVGRGCICSCGRGMYLSGTFRLSDRWARKQPQPPTPVPWKCAGDFGPGAVIETWKLAEILWKTLGWQPRSVNSQSGRPQGLVLFAAATNSAKTNVAKAFSLAAISRECRTNKMNKSVARLPHLVTYEDPIEKWRIGVGSENKRTEIATPFESVKYGFCITARERAHDVDSLQNALHDARRQTPKCFFVGEVRDENDWKTVLDFAGTGHLVVATSHAASLAEAVARILKGVGALTAADRRFVGSQLLAVVHLKLEELRPNKCVVLPTIWMRSPGALAALVGDGLSSILPNREFVLSRAQFLDKAAGPKGEFSKAFGGSTKDLEFAYTRARQLDMAELQQQ